MGADAITWLGLAFVSVSNAFEYLQPTGFVDRVARTVYLA
jgi:hypothetical protein